MNASPLYAIRERIGGTVYGGGARWTGPGPNHSKHDQSLSAVLTSDGRIVVHSFAGDDFRACLDHLGIERESAAPADRFEIMRARAAREAAKRERDREDAAMCARVWSETLGSVGTPVEAYLWSRGLVFESVALRFHSAAPRSKEGRATHPAMAGLVSDAASNPTALHLTFIKSDGTGKAFGDRSRLMFGPTAGCSVHLDPFAGGTLAVGEGIETSAAFGSLWGVPVWAALSTAGLRNFALPDGLRTLLIATDNDDCGAGLAAAAALADRASRVCKVEIHPAPEGQDWADVVARHG